MSRAITPLVMPDIGVHPARLATAAADDQLCRWESETERRVLVDAHIVDARTRIMSRRPFFAQALGSLVPDGAQGWQSHHGFRKVFFHEGLR